jgi:hypothetical protein
MKTGTAIEWISSIMPELIDKKITKTEIEFSECIIKAYWAGTIIRIDIKPK